jgi:hypothetical protein
MREIESMMRVESGDIAVLGGLMEDRLDNRTGACQAWAIFRFSARYSTPATTRREDGTCRSPAPDGDQ